MKITLHRLEVAEAIYSDENANWTRAGSLALAEFLEDYYDCTGEDQELDVVALRCDFSEHESLQAWIADHYGSPLAESLKSAGIDIDGEETEEETDDLIRYHVSHHAHLIEFPTGIIVSSF